MGGTNRGSGESRRGNMAGHLGSAGEGRLGKTAGNKTFEQMIEVEVEQVENNRTNMQDKALKYLADNLDTIEDKLGRNKMGKMEIIFEDPDIIEIFTYDKGGKIKNV